MTVNELRELLNNNATVPLWPEAGQALGLKRAHAYAAAEAGDIHVIRVGRLLKVPSVWLRQKLGLDTPVAA